jgi:hypothetical protein
MDGNSVTSRILHEVIYLKNVAHFELDVFIMNHRIEAHGDAAP